MKGSNEFAYFVKIANFSLFVKPLSNYILDYKSSVHLILSISMIINILMFAYLGILLFISQFTYFKV